MPVNPNHLTPEQRSKANVYVGKDALAGQYVPSGVTPEQAGTGVTSPATAIRGGGGAGRRFDPLDSGYGNGRVQLAANDSVLMMGLDDEKENGIGDGKKKEADIFGTIGDILSGKRISDAAVSGVKWVQDFGKGVKQSIDETYQNLLDMNYDEKEDFLYSDAKEYFAKIEFLKNYLTPEEKKKYCTVLFGNPIPYGFHEDGSIIVRTAPDITDPNSYYWNTHVKPEDFDNQSFSDLKNAPLILDSFVDDNTTEQDQGTDMPTDNSSSEQDWVVDVPSDNVIDIELPNTESNTQDENEPTGSALVDAALEYLGEPYYKDDGKTHDVDCSRVVKKALEDCGFELHGSSNTMAKTLEDMGYSIPIAGKYNDEIGRFDIDESILQPGDLLFYRLNDSREGKGLEVTHVAIYMGDGKILHSTPSKGGVHVTEKHKENWGLGQLKDEYEKEPILRLIVRIPIPER